MVSIGWNSNVKLPEIRHPEEPDSSRASVPASELEKIDKMLKSTKYNNRNKSSNISTGACTKTHLEQSIRDLALRLSES